MLKASYITGCVNDTELTKSGQSDNDLATGPTVGEPQVRDGKVRLLVQTGLDRFGDSAGSTAYAVTRFDDDLREDIGNHQVVFRSYGSEHAGSVQGPVRGSPATLACQSWAYSDDFGFRRTVPLLAIVGRLTDGDS